MKKLFSFIICLFLTMPAFSYEHYTIHIEEHIYRKLTVYKKQGNIWEVKIAYSPISFYINICDWNIYDLEGNKVECK